MVNLADTMKAFWEFIKGFKPKYHGRHDHVLSLPTKAVPSPAAVEVLLYEGYLRSMYAASHVTAPSRLKSTAVRLTSQQRACATSASVSTLSLPYYHYIVLCLKRGRQPSTHHHRRARHM